MQDAKTTNDLCFEPNGEPKQGQNNLILYLKGVQSLMLGETRTKIPAGFGEVTLEGYKLLEVNRSASVDALLVWVESPNGDEVQYLCSHFTVAR